MNNIEMNNIDKNISIKYVIKYSLHLVLWTSGVLKNQVHLILIFN